MTISQRIFKILENRKMTQKEFSEKTGILQSTISDWRKKNTNPASDKILIIYETLHINPYVKGLCNRKNFGRNVRKNAKNF